MPKSKKKIAHKAMCIVSFSSTSWMTSQLMEGLSICDNWRYMKGVIRLCSLLFGDIRTEQIFVWWCLVCWRRLVAFEVKWYGVIRSWIGLKIHGSEHMFVGEIRVRRCMCWLQKKSWGHFFVWNEIRVALN